jgi:ABC-2 type transport system permease protein
MGKIGIIIWREYSTRIRNKTFIIMSILGPLLVAGFITLMVWLPNSDKTEQKIMVVDETEAINISKIPDNKLLKFYYPKISIDEARRMFYQTDYTAILYIPRQALEKNPQPFLFCKKSPSFSTENYIKAQLENKFFEWRLSANSINPVVIHNSKVNITLNTRKLDEKNNPIETRTETAGLIGFGCAILIFMFLTLYGMQVMRGVMEEKTNRIVEVIVSSVKPFQLMMGKIIGVACVGITQFLIWLVLSTVLTTVSSSLFLSKIVNDTNLMEEQKEEVFKRGSNANFQDMQKPSTSVASMETFKTLDHVNIPLIVSLFFCYFLGGYLLYSAMFAAIGSAVDSEADTQQFMLPVMLPLIAGYIMTIGIIQNPDSDVAFWGSIIPFTSPIVMMTRIPLGPVPVWQIALSLAMLVAGFLFMTWLAGRIYRTGILMYGKKISWKELGKWITYKG